MPADPASASDAARAATDAAMARVRHLSDLAAAAGPTASTALAAWLAVTVTAAQQGQRATADDRTAAAAQLRRARGLLHQLGDQLVAVAVDLDRAAQAHVAAIQAAPVSGNA